MKEKKSNYSADVEIRYAEATAEDFRVFWDKTPEDIRKFVESLETGTEQREINKVYEKAVKRINDSRVAVLTPTHLYIAFFATLAGEVYAAQKERSDAEPIFMELLKMLRNNQKKSD